MKKLPLSQNRVALVDDADYEQLARHRWCYRPERNGLQGYAVRGTKLPDGRRRNLYLHRELVPAPPGHETIFLNGDRLDCRRSNLKAVTSAEARRHHRTRCDSESGYKGVSWNRTSQTWAASIRVDGATKHLGTFYSLDAAARAYDAAARRLHGPVAVVNFPDPSAEPPPAQQEANRNGPGV